METTQLALRREAQRARFRHAWWIALAAGATGNALLVLAMWASAPRPMPAAVNVMPAAMPAAAPAAPAPVIVSPVAPPVIVVVPPAAATPTAFGDLGPCPAPYRERQTSTLRQPAEVEMTNVMGAPTDSRWIAAWNGDDVFVSRDGGGSWQEVLDGPGTVVDVSFDCHGRVLVLREGNGLGMRDGSRETWRAVPGIAIHTAEDDAPYEATVIGGGRSIAVIGPRTGPTDYGEAWVALSDDGGVSWHHVELGWYEGKVLAEWTGDTLHIVVPWTDCMSEGIRLVTVNGAGSKDEELGEWMSNVAIDRGVVYGISESCESWRTGVSVDDEPPPLCMFRKGAWTALHPAPVEAHGEEGVVTTLIDGPVDVLVRNNAVQTITGKRLGRARAWPIDAEALGSDASGRVWGKDADGWLIRR